MAAACGSMILISSPWSTAMLMNLPDSSEGLCFTTSKPGRITSRTKQNGRKVAGDAPNAQFILLRPNAEMKAGSLHGRSEFGEILGL